MIDKELFNVHGFRGDYFEEYKGYLFSVSLDLFGFRSVMIVFPEGVDINKQYLIPKDEIHYTKDEKDRFDPNADFNIVAQQSWFTKLIQDVFISNEGDIYEVADNRQGLLIIGLGREYKLSGGIVIMVRNNDIEASYEKYKDFYNSNPEVIEQYDRFKAYHNTLEKLVDAEDRESLSKMLPKGTTDIVYITNDTVIELCHTFIDEIVDHERLSNKYSGILSKIDDTIKENKRRNKK